MNPRSLFRPKHPQLKEQCVSCPFREDNDFEFAVIVRKLVKASSGETLTPRQLAGRTTVARYSIREEAKTIGEFACHHTAYDADMKLRPESERRQCPGATAAFIAAGENRG